MLRALLCSSVLWLATSAVAQEKVNFLAEIQPIFQAKCYKCHGAEQDKGGLMLHNFESIEFSETIFGGEPDDSEVYLRLILPEDDEERMPKGGEPLPEHQIKLIRRWIEEGAEMPEEGDHAELALALKKSSDVSAANPEAIKAVADTGALIMPLAQDTNRLQVSYIGRFDGVGDEAVALLEPLAEQVTWLNLKQTEVTDAGLAPLAKLKNLTQLHLELTNIGDEALANLAGLEKLEYLNLYGTNVTDAGLEHVKGLKNLKAIYLWQTKVSYDAAMSLKESIPGIEEVNLGHDHPGVVKARLEKQIERAKKLFEDAKQREEEARSEKESAQEQLKEAESALAKLTGEKGDAEEESDDAEDKSKEESATEEKTEEKTDEKKDTAKKEESADKEKKLASDKKEEAEQKDGAAEKDDAQKEKESKQEKQDDKKD